MTIRNQPDLFGATPAQGDLFGEAAPQPYVYRPDPEKVRRRLEMILAEMRAAQTMPWSESRQTLFGKIFPDMANLLPDTGEGGQYILQFEAEWERLKAAA